MRNEIILEGRVADVEFNGVRTRINLECGNCTDEYCDADNVCVYANGNLESQIHPDEQIKILGHVVNESESVCVYLYADKIDKVVDAQLVLEDLKQRLDDLLDSSTSSYNQVVKHIRLYGILDDGVTDPEQSYEAGYRNAVKHIINLLKVEMNEE